MPRGNVESVCARAKQFFEYDVEIELVRLPSAAGPRRGIRTERRHANTAENLICGVIIRCRKGVWKTRVSV